ncbi:MAG: histidine phosphatase family protein [Ruminococcus sp.]|nr:histidine phosphatase family protein [Ruminococcus sp.]
MVKLYIVRHCQATGNVLRQFQGRTDTDITDEGKAQLRLLTERFRDIPVDIICSSDLQRAMLTAAAINTHHRKGILPTSLLREIDAGEWEGKDIRTFPDIYPNESELWENAPDRFIAPGGEAMTEVYGRAEAVLRQIVSICEGKTAVIVSHGCTIRNIVCHIKYGDIKRLRDVDWSKNTGVTYAEFDGSWKLIFENDLSHLPEDKSGSFSGRLR